LRKHYSLTWKAKEGVSKISVGLEEPKDANPENKYLTVSVEVVSPRCYSDLDCYDGDPCTARAIVQKTVENVPYKDEPCWKWECVNGECQCELQANCCGNMLCELGEDSENCPIAERLMYPTQRMQPVSGLQALKK